MISRALESLVYDLRVQRVCEIQVTQRVSPYRRYAEMQRIILHMRVHRVHSNLGGI